jgi:hypothetical protein
MTRVSRLDALDKPLRATVVDGEVVASSDQEPVELAVTADAARETGRRLIAAADEAAKSPKKATSDNERLDEGLEETFPASDPVSAKHID